MNTLKNVLGLVVAVVLLGLAVWFVPQYWPEKSLDGNLGGTPATPLPITEITQSRHADVAGTDGCDVRLLYPQIADDGALQISADAREKMNGAILAQVQEFLSANAGTVDEAATAFVTSCQADLTEAMSWMNDSDDAPDVYDDPYVSLTNGWETEIGYNMKLNDGKYLSLGIAQYLFTGGAHPNITELFLTFDVTTGETLALRDVVPDDEILNFFVQEKQWLVDNMREELFEEVTTGFEEFLANPTLERAEQYRDAAIMYLTPSHIVTFYNPYMIAPYTAGPIEAMIAR